MKSHSVLGVIGFGVALLVLSGLWATLFPPTRNWTPEKETRWQAVKARIHTLSFFVGRPAGSNAPRRMDPAAAKAEYDKLQVENELLNADFESAANSPKRIASMLRWTGISLAAVGIVGWYAVRQT